MAQDSWPSPGHNDRAVNDAEYEQLSAPFADNGVIGDPTLEPVVTAGAGLTVNLRANVAGCVRGFFWTSGDGDTLEIAANSSGQTRMDWVVLRLTRSDWTVRAAIRQGTPGAGIPALVQDPPVTGVYEIALAQVTLLSGAGTVTVNRNELYLGTGIRPQLSSRPNSTPVRGELHYQTDTDRVALWNGSAWRNVISTSGIVSAASPLAAWSIVVEPTVELRNGSVHLRLGQFNRTGGALDGAADSRLPVLIPAEYRHPSRNQYATCYITGAKIGRVTIYPVNSATPGQVLLTQKPDISTGDDVLPGNVSWAVD